MPDIPRYDQWKSETSTFFHRRGKFLTALDQAIELQDRERIATAIDTLCAHGQTDENTQQIDDFLNYLLKGGPKPAGYVAGPLNRESRLAKLLEQAMV